MRPAMNNDTSSGRNTPSASAFRFRIAILVSRSGGLDVRDQPHSKPAAQAFFELADLGAAGSRCSDDLLLSVVQALKCGKTPVCVLFADDELDVVNQQDVDTAIALAGIQDAIVLNRIDDSFMNRRLRCTVSFRPGLCVSTWWPIACMRWSCRVRRRRTGTTDCTNATAPRRPRDTPHARTDSTRRR